MDSVAFEKKLYPRRSLHGEARQILLYALVALPMSIGLAFAWVGGAWLVLPFAGLEVLVIVLVLRYVAAGDSDYQTITVNGPQVAVETLTHGSLKRRDTLLAWTRLAWYGDSLCLVAHGKHIEVGSLLSLPERKELAQELQCQFDQCGIQV